MPAPAQRVALGARCHGLHGKALARHQEDQHATARDHQEGRRPAEEVREEAGQCRAGGNAEGHAEHHLAHGTGLSLRGDHLRDQGEGGRDDDCRGDAPDHPQDDGNFQGRGDDDGQSIDREEDQGEQQQLPALHAVGEVAQQRRGDRIGERVAGDQPSGAAGSGVERLRQRPEHGGQHELGHADEEYGHRQGQQEQAVELL